MAKFGVLGTGMVGAAIASRLIELGHDVCMGSRTPDNEKATAWAADNGDRASHGTFEDAALFGDTLFNCLKGEHTLATLSALSEDAVSGKVLIDVANALDFSNGMPPSLSVVNTDSLAEQIQRALPSAHVVKSLNTMNCSIMVRPATVPGNHSVFICGNDEDARATTASILREFGWTNDQIVDLGDLTAARGTEMFLPLWLRIYQSRGSADFNVGVFA